VLGQANQIELLVGRPFNLKQGMQEVDRRRFAP
jgi:hypothetical protein